MTSLPAQIQKYLAVCANQKKLSPPTLKAYAIDLKQFVQFQQECDHRLDRENISQYIAHLHETYKPKSAKRKIASLKAFLGYLEFEEILTVNPFSRIQTRFQEPHVLPRTIPFADVQDIFRAAYSELNKRANPGSQKSAAIRDVAVLELLFATGMRVSELCSIKMSDLRLSDSIVCIDGKGSRQRIVQLGNPAVVSALVQYINIFERRMQCCGYMFVNRLGNRLSEQSVRFMIRKYSESAGLSSRITPHMFRHTFATLLLEEDVDIRYIQQILGHSSIVTTQIYTHVSLGKQKEILTAKHPRNRIVV